MPRSPVPLDLPPLYRAVVLGAGADAFAHACRVAADEGAGTIVWSPGPETLDFAVILEPEEPLVSARRALYAAMAAMADALRRDCPPEKPLQIRWPDTFVLDGGVLGGARMYWPEGAQDGEPPAWLVIGFRLRLHAPPSAETGEGGHPADSPFHVGTSLQTEGYEVVDAQSLIEQFCRHLMVHVHAWQETGFEGVARAVLGMLEGPPGQHYALTTNGDLAMTTTATETPVKARLIDALGRPQWLDPVTGEPML